MSLSKIKHALFAPVELTYGCGHAWQQPIPVSLKRQIIRTEMALLCRRCWGAKNQPVQQRVGNFLATSANLPQLAFLHREIFVNLEYCFRARRDDPLIIDCGSNIGMAILFFKTLYPSAHIIGFEPAPPTFAMLQANVSANRLKNVAVHQAAVGREAGMVSFYLDRENPGALTMGTIPLRSGGEKVTVRQVPLSEYINGPVDLLKLDVEGAENGVLDELIAAGAIRQIEQMFIEYHHHLDPERDELTAFLSKLERSGFGYQIRGDYVTAARLSGRRVFQDLQVYAYRK